MPEDRRDIYVKYFLWLAAGFSFLTYAHDVIKEVMASTFTDFYHYFMNTKLLLQGYNIWEIDSPQVIAQTNLMISQLGVSCKAAILHSTGFFLIFSPLTLLPPQTASIIWVLLCQISFVLSAVIIFKMAGRIDVLKALCGIFLVFNFWPLREDLHLGQPNALILLLLSLSLFSLKHKQFLLAGIFLGLGIQIKEFLLPMLLFCLRKKYWKMLAGALFVLVLIKCEAIFVFGIDKELSYWKHHAQFFSSRLNPPLDRGIDIYSVSLIDLWHRVSEGILYAGISQLLTALFFSFVLWRVWKVTGEKKDYFRSEDLLLEFSLFLTFCFIISPWVHEIHLIMLCLPLLFSWFYIASMPARKNLILFVITYLILGLKYSLISFPFFTSGRPASLLAVKAAGFVSLFFLIDGLLRERIYHKKEGVL